MARIQNPPTPGIKPPPPGTVQSTPAQEPSNATTAMSSQRASAVYKQLVELGYLKPAPLDSTELTSVQGAIFEGLTLVANEYAGDDKLKHLATAGTASAPNQALLEVIAQRAENARLEYPHGLDLDLKVGSSGPEVKLLGDYLSRVGLLPKREKAPFIYDEPMRQAVLTYAKRSLSDDVIANNHGWRGESSLLIVPTLVKQMRAAENTDNAVNRAVSRLATELVSNDASSIGQIVREAELIASIPSNTANEQRAKIDALRTGFESLKRLMNDSLANLSAEAQREWKKLSTELEVTLKGDGATALNRAGELWSGLKESVDVALANGLAPIFDALRDDTVQTLLQKGKEVREMPSDENRTNALKTFFNDRLRPELLLINLEGKSESERQTIIAARDAFIKEAAESIQDGTIVTMAGLAHQAFVRHLHNQIESRRASLDNGKMPSEADEAKLSRQLGLLTSGISETSPSTLSNSNFIDDKILLKLSPKLKPELATTYAQALNASLGRILDPRNNLKDGAAHTFAAKEQANIIADFLSQIAHETGGFRYFKELGGSAYFEKMYGHRKDLGIHDKIQATAAAGQGALQTTGFPNKQMFFENRANEYRQLGQRDLATEYSNVAKRIAEFQRLNKSGKTREANALLPTIQEDFARLHDPSGEAFGTAENFWFHNPHRKNLNFFSMTGDNSKTSKIINGKYPANGQADRNHGKVIVLAALAERGRA